MPASSSSSSSSSPSSHNPDPPPSSHPVVDDDQQHHQQQEADDEESTPFLPPPSSSSPSSFRPRAIVRIPPASALVVSVLTMLSLFATAGARRAGPGSFNLPWATKEGINGVVGPVGFFFLFLVVLFFSRQTCLCVYVVMSYSCRFLGSRF